MKKKIAAGVFLGVVLLSGGFLFVNRPKVIPADVVKRSVIQEAAVLAKAEALPSARTFLSDLHYQSNGSVCGPASLSNVFRVFGEAATTEGAVLDGTGRCPLGYCFGGLTLDELAEVARKHTKRKVTVLRDISAERFREELVTANGGAVRYVVNFHRKPIFGMGGGHHSPIGGYLETEDLVLVLDVNENYKPWLVSREKLFAAMDTFDGEKKRGLLRFD